MGAVDGVLGSAEQTGGAEAPIERRGLGAMSKKKILLVDDSNVLLRMEKMVLERCGDFEIVTACNGREGVEAACRERPDLILLDVVMPVLTGFEACRELKKIPETKDIPIIFVSTRGESENVEEGLASGGDAFVTKPIDASLLKSKLDAFLGDAK
jgi:two-component system phosphate regulon response regulator PhoB